MDGALATKTVNSGSIWIESNLRLQKLVFSAFLLNDQKMNDNGPNSKSKASTARGRHVVA